MEIMVGFFTVHSLAIRIVPSNGQDFFGKRKSMDESQIGVKIEKKENEQLLKLIMNGTSAFFEMRNLTSYNSFNSFQHQVVSPCTLILDCL